MNNTMPIRRNARRNAPTLTLDTTPMSRSPFTTDYYAVTPVSVRTQKRIAQAKPIPAAPPRVQTKRPVLYVVDRWDFAAVLVALVLAVSAGAFWATLAHGSKVAELQTRISNLQKANADLQEANDALTNEVCNDQ